MKVDAQDLLALKHIPQHFGGWLRERREQRKLSLRAMGALLDLSPMFLCDIEHGNRRLLDHQLPRFASVLGTTVEQLVARRCELEGDLATWVASHPNLVEWLRTLRGRDPMATRLE
jgi:transcriptional regulator with XRE-family HTH domain